MRLKMGGELDMVHSFYEIEPNTLDVLILGSSHAYYSFQPNILWEEQGYTSYVMGSPQQSVATSYFLLKDALRRQKPKAVLFEGYYLPFRKLIVSESRLRSVLDAMPNDEVKEEALNTFMPELTWREKLNWYFPLSTYHNRWAKMNRSDFYSKSYLRGGKLDLGQTAKTPPNLDVEPGKIPKTSKKYFEKILALCRENDIELITYITPYTGSNSNKSYKRRLPAILAEEAYMKELGVPCLSYLRAETVGIDYSTDFRDSMHLNLNGQRKITSAIGAYLKENYNLEDHRGDERYRVWEEGYQKFQADLKNGNVTEDEGNG